MKNHNRITAFACIGLTVTFVGGAALLAMRPKEAAVSCAEGEVESSQGFTSAVVDANETYGLGLKEGDTNTIGNELLQQAGRGAEAGEIVWLGVSATRGVVTYGLGECPPNLTPLQPLPTPGATLQS